MALEDAVNRTLPSWLRLAVLPGLIAGCSPESTGPTFDPDAVPDAYRHSSAALMWPEATRAFRVTPEGDLRNGVWDVRVTPMVNADTAGAPRVIAYEERWRPVTHWIRRGSDVRWHFEAAALPEPAPRDTGLFVSIQVTVTNEANRKQDATIAFDLGPLSPERTFDAFDAPTHPTSLRWGTIGSRDTVIGWGAGEIRNSQLRFDVELAPLESRTVRAVLSAYPTPAAALADWARQPHERRAAQVRDYWQHILDRGTQFELGDTEVESALRSARVLLVSLIERRGELRVPMGGPFHYRDVWLRDGARSIHALAVSGHTEIARELARSFTAFQWPNGAFLSQRGQLDGTGQALWALEQALLRPEPAADVAEFAARAAVAVAWVESQREIGAGLGLPYGRMMPFADPRDGELLRAQLVGNDAWSLAGYRATERLLRAANESVMADSVARLHTVYQADFEAALERRAHPDLPPAWQGDGLDWGNLAIGWPCANLPPQDARCERIARRSWAFAGGAGLLSYHFADSAHTYVGTDLGTWALLAGHRSEADSVLAAVLEWRSASGAWCELFSRSTRDFGKNVTPHPTAAAGLIALVRNMVIEDHGDELQLTLGARSQWWRGSRVRGAPTRWGTIDLRFESDGERARWEWTEVPVWTTLTLPPGSDVAGPLPAPLEPGPRPGVVLAPPGTRIADVALVARP